MNILMSSIVVSTACASLTVAPTTAGASATNVMPSSARAAVSSPVPSLVRSCHGFRVVDLGGDREVVNVVLNNKDVVTGTYRDTGNHAFRWTRTAGWTTLPDLAGRTGPANSSHAYAINDAGYVVGDAATASGRWHPVIWAPSGAVTALDGINGPGGSASAINNRGDVAGELSVGTRNSQAFLWTRHGGMRQLGLLGGRNSWATDLNDADMVVGVADDPLTIEHAFAWTAHGGMVDIVGGSYLSDAVAVNDAGVVTGKALQFDLGVEQAFRWSVRSGLTILGAGSAGGFSAATGIDRRGTVAGWTPSYGAVVWTRHGLRRLFHDGHSGAVSISGNGWVTGDYMTPDGVMYAFRWSARTGVQLLPTAGAIQAFGSAINDRGDVVGITRGSDWVDHARLWISL